MLAVVSLAQIKIIDVATLKDVGEENQRSNDCQESL